MNDFKTKATRFVALAAVVGLAGCSEVLTLDVEAPGRIADDDLNSPTAIPGLVAGMGYDLTQAVDGALQEILLAGGEIWHSGSYDFGTYPRGILQQAPEDWDGEYGSFQQARWVAEDGLRRISEILEPAQLNDDPDVARAYLMAGFANRWLGENQCSSTIDGGPEVPNTEHFNRADSLFSRAISVATAAGRDDLARAGRGGLASIRAWAGDWPGAVTLAQAANAGGADWSYDAIFSTTSGAVLNDLVDETTDRREFSVFNTIWANEPQDNPRVTWQIPLDGAGEPLVGQDGETLFYQQLKFLTEDDDIPLTSGPEMWILEAEAALRANQLDVMTDRINDIRTFYGEATIAQPATVADAWPVLHFERHATLWLEGRRLWDLRRWDAEGGVVRNDFADGRDLCFPISLEEQRVNPNLGGFAG
jgi:hypothetical protein